MRMIFNLMIVVVIIIVDLVIIIVIIIDRVYAFMISTKVGGGSRKKVGGEGERKREKKGREGEWEVKRVWRIRR